MKTRLLLNALLIASLSGCASTMSNDECSANLGACLVVGTAQTVSYVAAAALMSSLDDHQHRDRNHGKKKRGR